MAFTTALPVSSEKLLKTTKAILRSQQITTLYLNKNIYQCACIISVPILYEKKFPSNMSQPLKCFRTSSQNHSQLPSFKNSGTLSWVEQQDKYNTLIDNEGVREYLTRRESCILPLSHWHKIVTVCLLFTIYLIIKSNKNSFPDFPTLSKTYALNLTRTKLI